MGPRIESQREPIAGFIKLFYEMYMAVSLEL